MTAMKPGMRVKLIRGMSSKPVPYNVDPFDMPDNLPYHMWVAGNVPKGTLGTLIRRPVGVPVPSRTYPDDFIFIEWDGITPNKPGQAFGVSGKWGDDLNTRLLEEVISPPTCDVEPNGLF